MHKTLQCSVKSQHAQDVIIVSRYYKGTIFGSINYKMSSFELSEELNLTQYFDVHSVIGVMLTESYTIF